MHTALAIRPSRARMPAQSRMCWSGGCAARRSRPRRSGLSRDQLLLACTRRTAPSNAQRYGLASADPPPSHRPPPPAHPTATTNANRPTPTTRTSPPTATTGTSMPTATTRTSPPTATTNASANIATASSNLPTATTGTSQNTVDAPVAVHRRLPLCTHWLAADGPGASGAALQSLQVPHKRHRGTNSLRRHFAGLICGLCRAPAGCAGR
jgi:hypothetical protein